MDIRNHHIDRMVKRIGLVCLVALVMTACAGAPTTMRGTDQPVVSRPVLRIETGMHMAHIGNMVVDAAQKILVTCSNDKTLRVWDVDAGNLLKTIRIPIGEGNFGALYAVAISPDGRTIAAGGYDWQAGIYIIDRASGAIRRRITGCRGGIWRLAFSKDGRYLAAGVYQHGLFVFSTATWKQVAARPAYNKESTAWVDFANDGRLVTASFDGYIRLFDAGFKQTARHQTTAGRRPDCAAFSPDGTKIAVTFNDTSKITVLSAQDLSVLYRPDTSGDFAGAPARVAWSADSQQLMAAGRWWRKDKKNRRIPIRIWKEGGRGTYRDIYAADNTILGLVGLKDGSVLFSSADPAWGIYNSREQEVLRVSGRKVDFRYFEALRVSADGQRVGGVQKNDAGIIRFDMGQRRLSRLDPASELDAVSDLAVPARSGKGLRITDWRLNLSPKLNRNPLPLNYLERSWSVAVAPGARQFVLGADWYLRGFNHTGQELWKRAVNGAAFRVNITGNGQLIVAALGDGTIRWYRLRDGEPLLTLFIHKDGKRWVAWTPSGYYAAAPGAEDLIGWHVNRGPDQAADFFPASRFRSTKYRPDVVERVLATLDEDKALALANAESGRKPAPEVAIEQQLPPVVDIISPDNGGEFSTGPVRVTFAVRSREPIIDFKVLVNGRPVPIDPKERESILSATNRDGEKTVRVPVGAEDARISLIAENRHATSTSATVRLKWQPPLSAAATPAKTAPSPVKSPNQKTAPAVEKKTPPATLKPKLYILAVGASKYRDAALALAYPVKDASDFTGVMKSQEGTLYREVAVRMMADPGRDAVLDGLEWLEKETTSRDVAMVFLAGHGVTDRNNNYYFLPVDGDPDSLKRTAIPYHEIKNTIANLPGKVIAFIDTCHAGGVMGRRARGVFVDIDRIANDLSAAENGVVVFTSSTGRQNSIEDDRWQNGAFTKALVEGLSGKADINNNQAITITELDYYLSERVKELTGGKQTPATAKPSTIQDFPIAAVMAR